MIHEFAFILFIVLTSISMMILLFNLNQQRGTRRSLWNNLMKEWINMQISEKNNTNAIQGFRNLILANSGLISALLVILGIIIGFHTNFPTAKIFPKLNEGVNLSSLQLILISCADLVGVFCLILSSRTATTLSFLISSDLTIKNEKFNSKELIENSFLSMQKFWIFGIRGLFLLIISLTWLIDVIFFIITTIIIFFYLIFIQDLALVKGK